MVQENNKKEILSIFIDLDGTIIDVSDRLYLVHSETLKNLGYKPISKTRYMAYRRNKLEERKIISRHYDSKIFRRYNTLRLKKIESPEYLKYDKISKRNYLTLQELSTFHNLILITQRKSRKNLMLQLESLNLRQFFVAILIIPSIKDKHRKAKKIKSNAYFSKKSVLIGDTEDDILSAKKLGIQSIAVSDGLRTKSFLSNLKPDYLVNALYDVMKLGIF